MEQAELFASAPEVPDGFVYRAQFISEEEERELLGQIDRIEFGPVRMHGVTAKRRVAHYGRGYEYDRATLSDATPIPLFLLPLRERVAAFATKEADAFAEALVTDYPAGAPIGWHRDAPAFDVVVGISLLSDCTMHFRRWPVKRHQTTPDERVTQVLQSRSAYILRGSSRTQWQHQIPAVQSRRISITFRTLRQGWK